MKILPIYNTNLSKNKLYPEATTPISSSPRRKNTRYASQIMPSYYFPNIHKRKISFNGIRFISISDLYKAQSENLRAEVEAFTKSPQNAELIGKGLSAEAFCLKKFPDIVIKKPFSKDETFDMEANNILLIPDKIKNSQKFIARTYDDTNNCYYLLTTKVNGKSANPQTNPWTKKHLNNLFNTLFEFDKLGIYHGDLNNGNIKLTDDGTVNFLDYQWTTQIPKTDAFSHGKEEKLSLPKFIYCDNSQMFEMAEMPYYLRNIEGIDETKKFLKSYLIEKSKYHAKRADYIEKLAPKWLNVSELKSINSGIVLEKAKSKLFADPSDRILKIATWKIQFLSDIREAYGRIDPNIEDKNILTAPSAYLQTMNSIQSFRQTIFKEINNHDIYDLTEMQYLYKEDEYGRYWLDNIKNWSYDIYNYVRRQITKNTRSYETKLYDFDNPKINCEKFGKMNDITAKVDQTYAQYYSGPLGTLRWGIFSEKMEALNKPMSQIKTYNINNNEINNIHIAQEKLEKAYGMLLKASQEESDLKVLNLSLLCALRARQLKEEVCKNPYLKDLNKDYATNMYQKAIEVQNKALEISDYCFDETFSNIYNQGHSSNLCYGYMHMNNFEI